LVFHTILLSNIAYYYVKCNRCLMERKIKRYIDRFEKIQNKFLKHLNYREKLFFDTHIKSAKHHGLMSLESRRSVADMTFLHKLLNNIVDAPELLSLVGFNCPSRRSRSVLTFRLPQCSSNYAQSSFIQRACGNYNAFFNEIDLFCSHTLFKKSMIESLCKAK
jgi:hypothetical protein